MKPSDFPEDVRRGLSGETLASEMFSAAGYRVKRVPVVQQRRGAGDLRLECPRTLLVSEIEVKACYQDGPVCFLELATHGGRELARPSGVMGSRAEHVLVLRMARRAGWLFRRVDLEDLVGDWLKVFVPQRLRDEGLRSARLCLPVPWSEIERHGRRVELPAPVVHTEGAR